jgi:hypothetical protein
MTLMCHPKAKPPVSPSACRGGKDMADKREILLFAQNDGLAVILDTKKL